MPQNTDNPTALRIKAKRASVSPKKLKERYEAGEDVEGQRAIVRLGTMNTRILTGQEDLSLWDDEELIRGQRKDRNGRFQGKPPTVVPVALHREITRRQMEKAIQLLNENVSEAAEVLVSIIKGMDTEDKDRLKAIDMLFNRVLGTAPVKVEVEAVKSAFEEFGEAVVIWDEGDVIDVKEVEAG